MVFVLSKDFVTINDTKDIPAIIITPILLLGTFYFLLNNMRKFLPVAPSLLILVSLMPYANAQNNLAGSQMNMTGSQMNMTGRPNEYDRQPNEYDRQPNEYDRQPNEYDRQPNEYDRQPNEYDRQLVKVELSTFSIYRLAYLILSF